MADTAISALASQTGAALATGDLFATVDISDTSMAGTGTDKKITAAELIAGLKALGLGAVDGWNADSNTWTVQNVPTTTGGTSTVASSLITKTAHGYSNGMSVIMSGFTLTTGVTNGALYYIVGVTTNTYQISATPGGAAVTFGGTADVAAITATGWNQFTVAVDATTWLYPGTKFSLNDTTNGVRYGVVWTAAFGSVTVVTPIYNSDYPIANNTLTAPRFSHGSPNGFPGSFAWTPTSSGWTTTPGGTFRWRATDRSIFLTISMSSATSNSATHTFTLPATAATVSGANWLTPCYSLENTTRKPGYFIVLSAGAVVTANGDLTAAASAATLASQVIGEVWYQF